jgi:hypothetical protein
MTAVHDHFRRRLFIVLSLCYGEWQSNPDSPQLSQSDQGLNINP